MKAVCANCGAPGATLVVDSALSVAWWNETHPSDQRSELWACNGRCAWELGERNGRAMAIEVLYDSKAS